MRSTQKTIFIAILFCFTATESLAQNEHHNDPIVADHIFGEYHREPTKRRRILNGKATGPARYNPLTYLAGGMLFIYQNVFSEQISAECTYEVSCSEHAKLSIEKYGLFKGTIVGLHQLSNCSPAIVNDCEEHMINGDGKIINDISYD